MRSRRPLRKVARTFTSWMRLALPSACSRESEEEPLQEQRRFPVMYPFARPSQLTTKSAGQQLHDWTSQSVYDEGRSSPFVLEQMGLTQVTTPSLLTKQGLCNILRSLISGPVSRSKYRSGFRAPPPPQKPELNLRQRRLVRLQPGHVRLRPAQRTPVRASGVTVHAALNRGGHCVNGYERQWFFAARC